MSQAAVDMILEDTEQLQPDLTHSKHPIEILGKKERVTWKKTLKLYKVQWSNYSENEATLEYAEFLQTQYPEFFGDLSCTNSFSCPPSSSIFSVILGRDLFKEGEL